MNSPESERKLFWAKQQPAPTPEGDTKRSCLQEHQEDQSGWRKTMAEVQTEKTGPGYTEPFRTQQSGFYSVCNGNLNGEAEQRLA